jgi:hypothetical protein
MKKKHGATGTLTFDTWCAMRARCRGYTGKDARDYRDRGITVCERWTGPEGFPNFLADMGEKPPGMVIDRIDNNGNYEPGNVRWTTPKVSASNRRSTAMQSPKNRQTRTRAQRHIDKLRAQGLRPVQIWVPDTRAPGFAAEARRQSRLLARHPDPELEAWMDENLQQLFEQLDAEEAAALAKKK